MTLDKKPNNWKAITTVYFLAILLITFLAYINIVPTELKNVPHYDSVGHFVLFGMFGLLVHLALRRRKTSVAGILVPIGQTLVILYAVIDEYLQKFSNNRTFDLYDLLFGILGIIVFYYIDKLFFARKYNR
jgi:polysaccharide biosynthesis protein VpsQ